MAFRFFFMCVSRLSGFGNGTVSFFFFFYENEKVCVSQYFESGEFKSLLFNKYINKHNCLTGSIILEIICTNHLP
jgi:hypothetical protein